MSPNESTIDWSVNLDREKYLVIAMFQAKMIRQSPTQLDWESAILIGDLLNEFSAKMLARLSKEIR